MSDPSAKGTRKIGFFGHPPVAPAARADYDRTAPDAPLFTVRTYPSAPDKIFVELPHQCDEWVVASGTKAEAIAELNAFIGAAIDALDRLTKFEP